LKSDIRVVKELPLELQSLDLEAIGSLVSVISYGERSRKSRKRGLMLIFNSPSPILLQVNDTDVMKEAKPSIYVKKILPILLKNRVVHFVGFGNRLSFDPIPFELQVFPFSIDCFYLPAKSFACEIPRVRFKLCYARLHKYW
jgi:hypothetical protein